MQIRSMLEKCFDEGNCFEVKGSQGGRPLVITSIIKPEKVIKTPGESIRRKHTHAIKNIVETQVITHTINCYKLVYI